MGDSTEFCSYNFILYIQVLQVVNSNISYSLPGSTTRIDGVAVTLREFLKAVDSYSIENDGEKDIRRVLRGHPQCEMRKKQFFNTTNSKKNTGTTKIMSGASLACVYRAVKCQMVFLICLTSLHKMELVTVMTDFSFSPLITIHYRCH